MIDASGGVLDQDYEIFEQATPHLVLKHEYLMDLSLIHIWNHWGRTPSDSGDHQTG